MVRVRPGVPVRLRLDRREDSPCSSRLVIPDLDVNQALGAFEKTTIELPAMAEGAHDFTCGMGMLHGRLLVGTEQGSTEAVVPATTSADPAGESGSGSAGSEPGDAEAAERNAEITDLRRRVIFGAVLTAPVLFAVMVVEFFGVTWVPDLLMNRWFQLVLIAPVMFYTGWPIHRTGWLALSHRTADMNSLITLGTIAAFGYSLVVTVAPGRLAGGRPRGLLRGGRGHHHPDPARPAAGDQGQGRHR